MALVGRFEAEMGLCVVLLGLPAAGTRTSVAAPT